MIRGTHVLAEGGWQMFIALVTFERDGDRTDVLPAEAQGACGWMSVSADHENEAVELFRASLKEIGLRLLEVEDLTPISAIDEAEQFDEHLAANMRNWEPGRKTVWGTVHVYLAAGEA